jgi:putative transposase
VRLTKRHQSGQQRVLRAKRVLAAAEGQSHVKSAQELSVRVDTVRLWRDRWGAGQGIALKERGGEERLADAPRPGAPARISAQQRCQREVLACEAPGQSGRPISQWSGREIAQEMIGRGIVKQMSRRHAARVLKKGAFTRTGSGSGSHRYPIRHERKRFMRDVTGLSRRKNGRSRESEPSAWMR